MQLGNGRNKFDPTGRGGRVGSDALKPDRIVGFRGIVAKWDAECFCVSGVIVNICLLFF